MTQLSLFWDGASIGDADTYAPYDLGDAAAVSSMTDVFLRALLNGTGNRGVLLGWLNELEVTGVATPVAVNSGGAVVYGMPYENTASVNVAVASPTNDTRYDRVVLRRDWAAQTIRITRIAGVEGGAVPALTQSPAPDGSGIYDVPLASLEVTTGGVITVTDEREWITMSTAPLDGVFETAHLANEGADWTAQETRSKLFFVGGGDWQPVAFPGRFYYGDGSYYYQTTGVSTWGSSAANEEGWQIFAAASRYGFQTSIRTPPDWVEGTDIDAYIWWMDDVGAVAFSAYFYSMYQAWEPSGGPTYSEATTNTLSGTNILRTVKRNTAQSIAADDLTDDTLVDYAVFAYNSAGADVALFLGVEFRYTGYL